MNNIDELDENLNKLFSDPINQHFILFFKKNSIVINPKAIEEILIFLETNFNEIKVK